jgi:hypothetical protein
MSLHCNHPQHDRQCWRWVERCFYITYVDEFRVLRISVSSAGNVTLNNKNFHLDFDKSSLSERYICFSLIWKKNGWQTILFELETEYSLFSLDMIEKYDKKNLATKFNKDVKLIKRNIIVLCCKQTKSGLTILFFFTWQLVGNIETLYEQ